MALTAIDLVIAAKENISEIEIDAAKSVISSHLVLDVREPSEHTSGCLEGAINIPRGVLEFKVCNHPTFQDNKDANIIVYCQSGGRSALAAEALGKLGFTNVTSLSGGFGAWKENGHQVVQP